MKLEIYCPDCGESVSELCEGYCEDCLEQRQFELDEFNARYDWWNSLSDKERDDQIKKAIMSIV